MFSYPLRQYEHVDHCYESEQYYHGESDANIQISDLAKTVQVMRHQSEANFYFLVGDRLVVVVSSLHHTQSKCQKCFRRACRILYFRNFIE